MNLPKLQTPGGWHRRLAPAVALSIFSLSAASSAQVPPQSVAREWSEQQLSAIRLDLARPTVTARNLYHVSVAMWDAWATYDFTAHPVIFQENHATNDPNVEAYRNESISYAAYRMLIHRYSGSPGAAIDLPKFDQQMADLGYDKNITTTVGDSPAAIGNRIAATVIAYGLADNANEANGYKNIFYASKNEPLIVGLPGNLVMASPNTWQPLAIQFFIDQNGNPVPGGAATFLSAEWGKVLPFALGADSLNIYQKDGTDWWVYHDPGQPPELGGVGDDFFKSTHEMTLVWSSHLDPADGVMIDISPNALGNATLPNSPLEYNQFYKYLDGGDNSAGYTVNPVTGQPYAHQMVHRGDYARCLAEFWADGPNSETPPGHWFSLINYVSDQPGLEKRIGGVGPIVSDLEWDVKGYLALGGAMHDSAVACWGIKGYRDFVRPVSAIRHMASLGQSTDVNDPSYNPLGLPLIPGVVEIITAADTAPGGKMEHLAGYEGQIAARAWRGPDFIVDPATEVAGVDWILASYWWPYQRPTFVTPPFAGFTSGHSTYSRAGAVTLDRLTGSPYFPGGLGTFVCPKNQFLVFEDGPSETITMEWASYYDASDQCSLSRIWGGIHPPADDIPARKIGVETGNGAFNRATALFSPWTDLGNALPGVSGSPLLVGTGKLDATAPSALSLSNARPSSTDALLVSLSSNPIPFKGGIAVANPAILVLLGSTSAAGTSDLSFHWPTGIASGTQVWFQYAVRDPAAVQKVALSNAVRAVTP